MPPRNRGPQVAGITYTFVIISTIATLLRVYCRGWVIKSFAADDWLAVAAQILFIIFSIYEIVGVSYGTGRHVVDIPHDQVHKAMQMWWTCEPLYVLTNMFIKASIAIFLLRICVKKVHRIIIYVVVCVTEIYSLFFFLLFILQCRPTSLFWLRVTENPPHGSCLDAKVVANAFYGYSAISCWTDWTYSILPVFLVWNLQMDTRMKISVVLLLAAGAIASSATIVRFPYLHFLTDLSDFLHSTADIAIWSTTETGIGITTSALATLRPLLRSFFGGSTAQSGDGTSARQWRRTGSEIPKSGYIRSSDQPGESGFELHNKTGDARFGVTTVIDRGDLEGQKYGSERESDGTDSVTELNNWSGSQSEEVNTNLPDKGNGWNITVKKSVVQTRKVEVV